VVVQGSGAQADYLTISSGGMEDNGFIRGGSEIMASGAAALGDPVYDGGSVTVQSGGVVSGQEVLYDGTMTVENGGFASMVIIESGTLEVARGAVGGVYFYNSGADELVSDAAGTFHGTVADLGAGDQIDLAGVAFAPTVKKGQVGLSTSGGSSTLTVTDGVHTASVELLGAYMASEFVATSDGDGGSLITFTSATSTNGHGNAVAAAVTS